MNGSKPLFGKYNQLIFVIIGFILTTIVGNYISQGVQERSWIYENKLRIQENEVKEATGLFENISCLLDKRIYLMRKIVWGYKDKKKDMIKRWDNYRAVLNKWNEELNKNYALIQRYFGEEARLDFEFNITKDFINISNRLALRDRDLQVLNKSLDSLNIKIRDFNLMLLYEIQKKEKYSLLQE